MTHRVGMVVFDGVTMLDVTGPAEVFAQASARGRAYEVVLVSPGGGSVNTSSGIPLPGTVTAAQCAAVDTVLVAGGENLPEQVDDALREVVETLAAQARRVVSVCTGAFVLAAMGLLDGRRATTHWRHADTLARRHEEIRVEADAIHVRDGRYVTSAGITAGIDLALALVEDDHGTDVARAIAGELVMFLQRPGGQAQFATPEVPADLSPELRAVVDAVLTDPAGEHGLAQMAATASMSTRHLTRLFGRELHTTPGRWVEQVRLGRAKALLLDGGTVTAVARDSGFVTDESMRRAFVRHLGITPSDYRRRFTTTTKVATP